MANLDSHNRLRVCEPLTTFDYYPNKNTYDTDIWYSMFSDYAGHGNFRYDVGYDHVSTTNSYLLFVITPYDFSIRFTRKPMEYESGKNRMVFVSGVLLTALGQSQHPDFKSQFGLMNIDVNLTTTTNIFSDFVTNPPKVLNGIFIRTNNFNVWFVEVIQCVENAVLQANWNIDKLDGNGPSGVIMTLTDIVTSVITIVIDQQWMGAGRTRVGFNINGSIYYVHQFLHNNFVFQNTTTGAYQPKQRIVYYICCSDGGVIQRQLSSCCIIDGGNNSLGKKSSKTTDITGVLLTSHVVKYVVLGLVVGINFPYTTFKPTRLCLSLEAPIDQRCYWSLQVFGNDTIQGTYTYYTRSTGLIHGNLNVNDYEQNSGVISTVGTGQTVIINGNNIISGFLTGSETINIDLSTHTSLCHNMIGTSFDKIILVAQGSNNNQRIYTSIDIIENG